MARRGAATAQDPVAGVEALAGLSPAAEPPEPSFELNNPGNFPEDAAAEPEQPAVQAPSPEPSEAAPIAEPDEPQEDWKSRYDDADRRMALLERELEMVRRGQQAPQQQPPQDGIDPFVQQALAPLTVRPDVLESLGIPATERNVQIVGGALQASALIGAEIAKRQMYEFYQREQAAQGQQRTVEQQSNALRDSFWKDNPDLEPYGAVVKACAQEVAAEADQRGFNADQAKREVTRRAKAELRKYGINLTAQPAATPGRPARLRPAMAEMGGGRTNGSGQPMSAVTKQIMKLAGM